MDVPIASPAFCSWPHSAKRPGAFNADLDGPNFDGQSILIEIRRGSDATAMMAIARKTVFPNVLPAEPHSRELRVPAIRLRVSEQARSFKTAPRAPPVP